MPIAESICDLSIDFGSHLCELYPPMTAQSKSKTNTDKTPLEIIQSAMEIIQGQTDALVNDLQRQFQNLANSVQQANKILGKNVLDNSAFEQALAQMALCSAGSAQNRTKRTTSKELPPVKESPLGLKIAKVVKDKGKANAATIVEIVGADAKPATVKNYVARLFNEGVLTRVERGVYAIK